MNGWEFLFVIFLAIIGYKALEVLCFMVVGIFACFTNGKNNSLEVLLNTSDSYSKGKKIKNVAKKTTTETKTKKDKKGEE